MPAGQIDAFMRAISGTESGGNYQARNRGTGAYGRFQILPSNWPSWSKETFGRVVAQTPANQNAVARAKMLQYYRNYGSWDLVAAAWFGGPGAASALKRGQKSVLRRSDGNLTIGQYINKMRKTMRKDPKSFQSSQAEPFYFNPNQQLGGLAPPDDIPDELPENDTEDTLALSIIQGLSSMISGQRPSFMPQNLLEAENQGYQDELDLVPESSMSFLPDAFVPPPDEPLLHPANQGDTGLGRGQVFSGKFAIGPPSKKSIPGGLKPNARRVARAVRMLGHNGVMGGIGSRPGPSDHPHGGAVDIMVPLNSKGKAQGTAIANYLWANRKKLGVKYIIWNNRIASATQNWKWRRYRHYSGGANPTLNHEDHVHASVYY